MSDAPGALPLGLSLQRAAKSVDPEQLELMGKKAAALYGEGKRSLSEAVVDTVKQACLSPEQVKRVCEFANTNAYLSEFEKSGEMRNVTFTGGPADPGYVLKDLNDGGNPALNNISNDDYQAPALSYKTASLGMDKVAEAFGFHADDTKTASAVSRTRDHASHINPADDVNDLRMGLERAKEDASSKLASARIFYDSLAKDLCDAVTQAVETGTDLGDIGRAWSGYTEDARLYKEAMSKVSSHLRARGHKGLTMMAKIAGVIPNPAHPVIAGYVAFTKAAHACRVLDTAIKVLDEQLLGANKKLHELVS
jgi:hypothetical protein